MTKWLYLALSVGWVSSMVYECVLSGGSAGHYFAAAAIPVTLFAILFVRDVVRGGGQKPVPRMFHFLGAAISCGLFYMALENAAKAGSHVRLMPFYIVMFCFFMGAGIYSWWKELGKRR